MIVVAGPPGSGKSTLYPVSSFGVPYFNADDRAAELNGGSYVNISSEIRKLVNREFEAFVLGSIETRNSFAIETTLRSEITFEQARRAKQAGFVLEMRYLALRDFASHLERVKARAPTTSLRRTKTAAALAPTGHFSLTRGASSRGTWTSPNTPIPSTIL
jgi:predicted ABC-type ATPase